MTPSIVVKDEEWQDLDSNGPMEQDNGIGTPAEATGTSAGNSSSSGLNGSAKKIEGRSSIESIKRVSSSSLNRRFQRSVPKKTSFKSNLINKGKSLKRNASNGNGSGAQGKGTTQQSPDPEGMNISGAGLKIKIHPQDDSVSPKSSANNIEPESEDKANPRRKYRSYLMKSAGGSLSPFRANFGEGALSEAPGDAPNEAPRSELQSGGSPRVQSPAKSMFREPSRFKKLRSKSDTNVVGVSKLTGSHHSLDTETFSGEGSDSHDTGNNTLPNIGVSPPHDNEAANRNNSTPGPQARDGPLSSRGSLGVPNQSNVGVGGNSFRKRINHTTDAFNRGFNFKNPWRKALGRRKAQPPKPEELQKSAELVTELSSFGPAVIILASQLQRDDKGMKRVPILLEQIRLEISVEQETPWGLVNVVKMRLNYGSGPARLSWTITKNQRDFLFLHNRLKALLFQTNLFGKDKPKVPELPRRRLKGRSGSSQPQQVPSGSHGTSDNHSVASVSTASTVSDDDANMTSYDQSNQQAQFTDSVSQNRPPMEQRQSSIGVRGRTAVASTLRHGNRKKNINPNYISELEEYMKQVFHIFQFRPDVNKLWHFLEVSNMSIRLAPEHAFHGKEGLLYIQSSSSRQGWRVSHWKPTDIPKMVARHNHKWFLTRHSYIVCVENINSTNVLEVFLVDSEFKISQHLLAGDSDSSDDESAKDQTASNGDAQSTVALAGASKSKVDDKGKLKESEDGEKSLFRRLKFTIQIENNERTLRLSSASEREISKWYESLMAMSKQTLWSQNHRFGSFAPVRQNVYAQWLIDARDYFWNLSEAISQAKDVIYIHDWWLSPELYLRRPPQGNQEWRLDRLLKRKAEEGVKIFVIVYRNVGSTIPIDSLYTKYSLLDLHENIYAMRSPNPLVNGTVFWAHHEKICMIDHTIAFLGGIDLCFGRYDTPDHVLADDKRYAFFSGNETDEELLSETQIWPGKDYSNARVKDFYNLPEPFEDMYDRKKVPRMPWHDIQMMVVGQPARDLSRHFVQRWNFLIRQKRPTRPTPLLLPSVDLTNDEVRQMDLAGTCELQILRSSGSWSLGLRHTEHSIQNAYLKAIETSEHFIYIENQFFVTSTSVEGTVVENKIGDALVERIIRAHKNGESWRAVIVIPLMPGFESQIDLPGASSVRVIMMCQYLSISRGPNSIFGKLESNSINPEDYIQFYSLRKWAKIGPNSKLVTEQLYIHAKILIADDRVAIIGSANINERSMRGNRDSEVAAIIRDKHQVDTFMGGKPYKAAKFAHSMRVRLMREHLGVDIDKVDLIDRELYQYQMKRHMSDPNLYEQPTTPGNRSFFKEDSRNSSSMEIPEEPIDPPKPPNNKTENHSHEYIPTEEIELHSFNHFAGIDNIGLKERNTISTDSRVQGNKKHKEEVEGHGPDYLSEASLVAKRMKRIEQLKKAKKGSVEVDIVTRVKDIIHELSQTGNWEDPVELKRHIYQTVNKGAALVSNLSEDGEDGRSTGVDTANLAHDSSGDDSVHPSRDILDPYAFLDPLDDRFYLDIWFSAAKKNTSLFRQVFRCQPDDEVSTWKEYKDFVAFGEKFSDYQDQVALQPFSSAEETAKAHSPLGTPPSDIVAQEMAASDFSNGGEHNPGESNIDPLFNINSATINGNASSGSSGHASKQNNGNDDGFGSRTSSGDTGANEGGRASTNPTLRSRKRATTLRSSKLREGNMYTPAAAEAALEEVQGNLVFFPTEWLSREFEHGNWWYNFDRLPPLDIFD